MWIRQLGMINEWRHFRRETYAQIAHDWCEKHNIQADGALESQSVITHGEGLSEEAPR